ncbi:MAG: methionine synthase [Streptosporangiaceae bacterium]
MQDTSPVQASGSKASEPAFPWPVGSATGVGSMPGTDPAQACAVVIGELPDFPYLPELPGRGVGADMIGRTAALLVDLPVETTPRGWKFATHPGKDQRRADGFLNFDLDAVQQAAEGYRGPFKISVCGPLTLAARIELSRTQNPALADEGALADLTASLAEGLAAFAAQVGERVPGATVLLQVDEPSLPAVLDGRIRTASGLNFARALDETVASATLRTVLEAAGTYTVVHCCAARFPFLFIRDTGARAVSFDLELVGRRDEDAVAEVAESGLGLLVGAVPTVADSRAAPRPPRDTAEAVVTLWRRMTLDPDRLAEQVVVTPACGLAGLSPEDARSRLEHCREAARIVPEMIVEGEAQ